MRIVGAPDYYDGTAFRSDGRVLSLLVYRRSDGIMPDRMVRRVLAVGRRRLRISLLGADGTRLPPRLPFGAHRFRWNGADMAIEPCSALFCGTLHSGAVVISAFEWSATRTGIERTYCWSSDALEEELARHGLVCTGDRHRDWFRTIDASGEARDLGICVATMNPTDRSTPRGTWRIDAPTLGDMDFDGVVPAKEALARIADWIGGRTEGTSLRVRTVAAPVREPFLARA